MKILRIDEIEVSKEKVERDKLFSVYVLGLPRSGTSLMTNICGLLGVNMVHTTEEIEKTQKRNELIKERFGEYHPNKDGFFEITENFFSNYLKVVSSPYSGCKMIIPVTFYRMEVMKSYPSKVIMMWRHPEEIRQSQIAFYNKKNPAPSLLNSLLIQQKQQLELNKLDFIIVHYRELLENSIVELKRIKKFIRSDIDISLALKAINPKRNRFKSEELDASVKS